MFIKKFSLTMLCLILMLSFIFGGCTAAQKPAPAPQNTETNDNAARNQEVKDNRNQHEDPENNKYQSRPVSNDQALKIAAEVDDVPGVVKSEVVVTGNSAYIGLYLNSNMKVNKSEVKQQVESKIRQQNTNFNSIYVSTNPDVLDRLRDINEGIANGKPSSTYDFDALEEVFKTEP
jgi:YhcN/YlaJ family sporulation lipoprotein